jgi:hypothetical protein
MKKFGSVVTDCCQIFLWVAFKILGLWWANLLVACFFDQSMREYLRQVADD